MRRRYLTEDQTVKSVVIGGITWSSTSIITDIYSGENYFANRPETLGSMFQWGRRYGAPSTVTTTIKDSKMTIDEGQMLSNASKLITISYSFNPSKYRYSWCTEIESDRYLTLWTSYKGIYDPCPEGWRIPTYEEIGSLVNANYREKGYLNDILGVFIGDYKDESMFIPFQPTISWGGLDSTFIQLCSCTLNLDNSREEKTLQISKDTLNFQYGYGVFPNMGGIIRAVKV